MYPGRFSPAFLLLPSLIFFIQRVRIGFNKNIAYGLGIEKFASHLRSLASHLISSTRKSLAKGTIIIPGCVSITKFCFWILVNSLSSTVSGYSEGRWSMANVGVHLYISTKGTSNSSVLLYSVVLWSFKNPIFSHMRRWSYRWVILTTFVFHPWARFIHSHEVLQR